MVLIVYYQCKLITSAQKKAGKKRMKERITLHYMRALTEENFDQISVHVYI